MEFEWKDKSIEDLKIRLEGDEQGKHHLLSHTQY